MVHLPPRITVFSFLPNSNLSRQVTAAMETLRFSLCTPRGHAFIKFPHPSPLYKSSPSCLHRRGKARAKFELNCASPIISAPFTEAEASSLPEDEEQFDWYAQWYPVAPICDLDKRVPHAKTVLGRDLVVWWDRSEEKWQVFEDLCPHRLAPLSEGRIDQWGRLQCVYHGWCFDGKGNCKLIPQAPADGPPVHSFKKACAIPYPSCEQNKILWFWPDSDPKFKDIAMTKRPPNIPELDDPSYSALMGMRDFPFGYEILAENLMDPAHVNYAHYGILRIPRKPNTPKRDREGGVPLDITVVEHNLSGFTAKQDTRYSNFTAPVLFRAAPDLSTIDNLENLKLTEEELSISLKSVKQRFLLVFICIPVSLGRSRLIWAFPRNFAVWIDKIVPRWYWHIGQNLVLDSDLNLLHLEERKIAKVGVSNWQKACFVPTKSDALVVAFRKWLKKYSNGQVNWGPSTSELQLPPTPPREQLLDRYWSHTVSCSSCRQALKGIRFLEISLQIASVVLIAGLAAVNRGFLSSAANRGGIFGLAVLCFVASRWISHFIHKNFYYHDYNHALL